MRFLGTFTSQQLELLVLLVYVSLQLDFDPWLCRYDSKVKHLII